MPAQGKTDPWPAPGGADPLRPAARLDGSEPAPTRESLHPQARTGASVAADELGRRSRRRTATAVARRATT